MTTRTIGKLHFDDLDPIRFEMLVMDMIYRMRRWESIEHFGVSGSDDGIDIQAVELLENGKRVTHHFQCKRYEKLTKGTIKNIVSDYALKNNGRPDYYYLVCGCNVSKTANDAFQNECKKQNFNTTIIWTASFLEAMLYSDYHDLLFAFFGVNMSDEYNKRVSSIRRNLALKKRMHSDFVKKDLKKTEDFMTVAKEPWRKFRWSKVLIRSVYDKNYPENDSNKYGYYAAEPYNWYHNGLMVMAHPYFTDAMVRIPAMEGMLDSDNHENDEIVKMRLCVVGCLPFENIIDYDIDGDEFYNYPHLYCDFIEGTDPYEKIAYFTLDNFHIDDKDIVEIIKE